MAASESLNPTERIVRKMMLENTGRHFLDSGIAFGRNYEENQENPPWEKPYMNVHRDFVSKNLYHHLTEGDVLARTKKAEGYEGQFYRFANRDENKNESWLTLMEQWGEQMNQSDRSDFYGSVITENSYNMEFPALSQCYQFTVFSRFDSDSYRDYQDYCLLRLHNGCDIRGGYTKPKVFATDRDYLIPSELSYSCRECEYVEYESCLYGSDNPPVFKPEENVALCPDCDSELGIF